MNSLHNLLIKPIKRKVFISYHHRGDQQYYNVFVKFFSETLDIFHDQSLDRLIESENSDYVRWRIRENHISGSSCTIVLCGAYTHQRKYVDWEIKATLDKQHGLIGIWLPTLPMASNGGTEKPSRLQDNIDSGYALWLRWDNLSAEILKNAIEDANRSPKSLISSQRPLRMRNGCSFFLR